MLPLSIDDLVREMKDRDASDLHLTVESKPMIRRRGELEPLEHHELLTPELTRDLLYRILSTEQQKVLETRRHIDMAYSIPGVGRLRVNVFFQRAVARRGVPHDPDRDPARSRARPSPAPRGARRQAARPRARHRADRLGEVDDACRADRSRSTARAPSTSSRSRIRSSSSTTTRCASSTSARSGSTHRRSPKRSGPRSARTRT